MKNGKNGKNETQIALISKPPQDSEDVKRNMMQLFADLRNRLVTPAEVNATCNIVGKTLKTVEMEYKLGREKRPPKRFRVTEKRRHALR